MYGVRDMVKHAVHITEPEIKRATSQLVEKSGGGEIFIRLSG